VNKGGGEDDDETPLQAAERQERHYHIGPLLVAGADPKQLYDGEATALGPVLLCWRP
jgi:hypothetical protein